MSYKAQKSYIPCHFELVNFFYIAAIASEGVCGCVFVGKEDLLKDEGVPH